MNWTDLSDKITTSLGLTSPPIAITFVDQPPDGIPGPPREVPSACSFWRDAERGTFYASSAAHLNCPVGAMVMGFALPEDVGNQLGKLVGDMCECHYLAEDEPARIPAVAEQHAGIVYGPLGDRTAEPDVVLMWASPQQVMLCNEAMGTASWTAGSPSVTGRPGCAALPVALGSGRPALSLGCAGMRTFTGVGEDMMLVAVPGGSAESFVTALAEVVAANDTMLAFYRGRRSQFSTAD